MIVGHTENDGSLVDSTVVSVGISTSSSLLFTCVSDFFYNINGTVRELDFSVELVSD